MGVADWQESMTFGDVAWLIECLLAWINRSVSNSADIAAATDLVFALLVCRFIRDVAVVHTEFESSNSFTSQNENQVWENWSNCSTYDDDDDDDDVSL